MVWFVSTIVDSLYPLVHSDIPEKVVLSACQLLLSLATTVRPNFGLHLPGVKELMLRAKDGDLSKLPHRVSEGEREREREWEREGDKIAL